MSFFDRMAAALYSELSRVDAKCSSLLGLASAGMALLVLFATTDHSLPFAAKTALWLSILFVGGSIAALLLTLRPRIGSLRLHGGNLRAAESAEQLRDAYVDLLANGPLVWRSKYARDYSYLVGVRLRQLKIAIDLLLVAVACIACVPVLASTA